MICFFWFTFNLYTRHMCSYRNEARMKAAIDFPSFFLFVCFRFILAHKARKLTRLTKEER